MHRKYFLSRSRPGSKNLLGSEFSCMCTLSYRAESRWWQGKNSVFLKCLLLNMNSKLDILDSYPNDGTVFPTTSKKINQNALGIKLSEGAKCTPAPVIYQLMQRRILQISISLHVLFHSVFLYLYFFALFKSIAAAAPLFSSSLYVSLLIFVSCFKN